MPALASAKPGVIPDYVRSETGALGQHHRHVQTAGLKQARARPLPWSWVSGL